MNNINECSEKHPTLKNVKNVKKSLIQVKLVPKHNGLVSYTRAPYMLLTVWHTVNISRNRTLEDPLLGLITAQSSRG